MTGAGSGIGLAVASALCARGCRVVLVDRDDGALEQAASTLKAAGSQVTLRVCDVARWDEVAALAASLEGELAPVGLLVNSAGVAVAGSFLETPLEDLRWVVDVNFWGAVHTCRAFLPPMLHQGEGHVVNVGSSFGLLGFPGKSGYAASKGALRSLGESLRGELAGSGVGLSTVYPGPVATGLIRSGRSRNVEQKEAENRFVARRAVAMSAVVRATLRAIEADRGRVLVGVDYHLIDWLARLSPAFAQWITARLARRLPF